MSSNAPAAPQPGPTARPPFGRGATVIVIVIILSAGLVLSGVAPSVAVGTLSAAGLAAVEILRRFFQIPAPGDGRA